MYISNEIKIKVVYINIFKKHFFLNTFSPQIYNLYPYHFCEDPPRWPDVRYRSTVWIWADLPRVAVPVSFTDFTDLPSLVTQQESGQWWKIEGCLEKKEKKKWGRDKRLSQVRLSRISGWQSFGGRQIGRVSY